MDKVDISTWKGDVRTRRSLINASKVPHYPTYKVLFFVNRCAHCKGDDRGVCENWINTNYCSFVHIYCPVSLLNGKFIERLDPNVTDVQRKIIAGIDAKPCRPRYYKPNIAEIQHAIKKAAGISASKLKVKCNGFRIRGPNRKST